MIDNEFSGKVKRYALLISGVCESYRGGFVKSSDYDSLLEQLDALELSRRSWMDEAKSLERRLSAPVVERQDGQHMACIPVERCYDVRAKMIIAFNESRKAGGDLDDGLDAAYKAALRYSPNPLLASPPAPVAVVDLSAGLESLAKQIYQSWESLPGFQPWIDGAVTAKQEEARQIASRTFELALANQIQE